MATTLLAKLKVKPAPQIREPIQITMPTPLQKEDVVIQMKIVDKTKTSGFDRELFLKGMLEMKEKEKKSVPAKEEKEKEKKLPKKKLVLKEKVTGATAPAAPPAQATAAATAAPPAPATAAQATSAATDVKEKKRLTKPPPVGVITEGPLTAIKVGTETIGKRMADLQSKDKPIIVSASSYYMSNRQKFLNFINTLFGKYKKELVLEAASEPSCVQSEDFSPMTHQKIVRDYLSLYTPYRGLLLYHGLGSGKTCSSIAIAEGLKTSKPIIVMTPASLQMNYIEELKKCGDSLYRKNQFWEFIRTKDKPELIDSLSRVLSLSVEYIKKAGGAWFINVKNPPNFDALSSDEKVALDKQLNEMILYKYKFISYNGLRQSHMDILTKGNTINPFDNAVVIIDEAHNFVSRIVNKIEKKKKSLSMDLYEYLMNAQNARIVLLTGTPMINYPNELGILFNILRGKIKTWHFKLVIGEEKKIDQSYLEKLLNGNGNLLDYLEYTPSTTTLTITRNPFGFINTFKNPADYMGVTLDERGNLDDANFIKLITNALTKVGLKIQHKGIKLDAYKAVPDKLDDFKNLFINSKNEVENMNLFKRRILGLTSYFRSAQEGLMPQFDKKTDFIVVKIDMSPEQFKIYEKARSSERKLEMKNAQKRAKKKGKEDIYDEVASTYRIFSRLFCNFVFPTPVIIRPMPSGDDNLENAIMDETNDEDVVDATSDAEKIGNVDGRYEADEVFAEAEASEAVSSEGMASEAVTSEGKASEAVTSEAVTSEAAATESTTTEVAPKKTKREKKAFYEKALITALSELEKQNKKYLTPEALQIYSPKFLNILENVKDASHVGLHLIYSQFRTLEGIGILKLILEANGFVQFKLIKEGGKWKIDIKEEDKSKPTFALYTGTESDEEKEMVRNIFNGNWKYIPSELTRVLKTQGENNMYGEIIKIFMITASGAEGISLENVRYVHITEPYWHPVRIEQVIGRARRICSHKNLPEELRNIKVFLYLMTLTDEQIKSEEANELRVKDKSKLDPKKYVTTDEALYEIATIKEDIAQKLLLSVKESAIDCVLHSKFGGKEQLQCFSFGSSDSNNFAYVPSIAAEELDSVAEKNKKTEKWEGEQVELGGVKYVLNPTNMKLYTAESFELAKQNMGPLVPMGTLKKIVNGKQTTYAIVPI